MALPRKAAKYAFATALDRNPAIRAALIKRMTEAAEKVPVVLLHQIVQALEMAGDEAPL